jgi:outer membrane protein
MKHISLAVIFLLSGIATANAQSAGQWVFNAGWLHLAPQDSSRPLSVSALGSSTTVPGSGATVSDADTFAFTATYFVTDHVAVETLLGVPPKLTLSGAGSLSSLGALGTARVWSPVILAQYHFGEPTARLRPYVGAGVSYVSFKNITLNDRVATGQLLASPSFGTSLEGPTSASLSNSFAPVINAGLAYNLDKHWSVGLSASYVWLSTRATMTTRAPVGTVTSSTRLKLDPIVTFASLGYRF